MSNRATTTIFDDLEPGEFSETPMARVRAGIPAEAEAAAAPGAGAPARPAGTLGHWEGCTCFACQVQRARADRAAARDRAQRAVDRAAARAQRAAIDRSEAFAAAFPAEWAWIVERTRWEESPRGNGDFGRSLQNGIQRYGSLTDRQMEAVRSGMARRAAMVENRRQNSTALDVGPLDAVFAVARANQAVKAIIRTGAVTFSLAKMTGANPGAIYAKSADGVYLGKIVGGEFKAALACTAAHTEEIRMAARDPKEAALRYARATDRCSICGRTLTDPASKLAGIGPDCAAKFGW